MLMKAKEMIEVICESVIGTIEEARFQGKSIEYVEIDWHNAFHRVHKKVTKEGTEVGIRLDHDVLSKGLRTGDVLYVDESKVIVVHIPPCDVIVATVEHHHDHMIAKLCYEVGNRHSSLFWGEDDHTFIIPFNEPMFTMLGKLHGVQVKVESLALDFNKAISSTINAHTH